MTAREAAIVSVIFLVGACSKPPAPIVGDLITVNDYPKSIDMQLVTGELFRSGNCIVFAPRNGASLIPVFSAGNTFATINDKFGDLKQPRLVTVSGMTIINPVPREIADAIKERGCRGQPFYFGQFDAGEITPEPPRA